jgi:hypothetical protein
VTGHNPYTDKAARDALRRFAQPEVGSVGSSRFLVIELLDLIDHLEATTVPVPALRTWAASNLVAAGLIGVGDQDSMGRRAVYEAVLDRCDDPDHWDDYLPSTHWTIGHTTENVTVTISSDHGELRITPDDLTDLGAVPVEDGTEFVFRPGSPSGDGTPEVKP